MSALSDLASKVNPQGISNQPVFSEKFKVRTMELEQSMLFNVPRATKQLSGVMTLNDALKYDIWEAGDALEGRNSSASCFMTQWKMHEDYESFRALGAMVTDFAKDLPLALRTNDDGTPDPITYFVNESWGLIYRQGHICKPHTHWPSVWSYTYCVEACEDCAPLAFPTVDEDYYVYPKTGQLTMFPSWVNHYVPEHECEHERIMISGNLDVKWYEEYVSKPDWAV